MTVSVADVKCHQCFFLFQKYIMKKLSDGFEVSIRAYYYLLDWNDSDGHNYILNQFHKSKIKDLTRVEFKRMFNMATTREMNSW